MAICDDASAVMWNPAGLYQLNQKEINTIYISLFEDTHYGFISYAHPTTGVLSFGISALSLYSGDLVKRDSNNNPKTFNWNKFTKCDCCSNKKRNAY